MAVLAPSRHRERRSCCCGVRAATVLLGVVGLALSVAAAVPPMYVHLTDQRYEKLFPVLPLARDFLRQATLDRENAAVRLQEFQGDDSDDNDYDGRDEKPDDDANGQKASGKPIKGVPNPKYKSAILQLMDDIERHSPCLALVAFAMGAVNIPLHLLLVGGALCRSSCLMLPWLAVTLLEYVLMGVPAIVFVGIIALYMATQLQLCAVAAAIVGSILVAFALALSSWATAYSCYGMLYNRPDVYVYTEVNAADTQQQQQQALLQQHQGHQGGGGGQGYHLGQYPQYYPPHQNRQLPSAPPNGGLYPQLNMA